MVVTNLTNRKYTKEDMLNVLWEHQLNYQNQYFYSSDLKYFQSNTEWHRAKDVLDIGCGNGKFLSFLAEHFPDRHDD